MTDLLLIFDLYILKIRCVEKLNDNLITIYINILNSMIRDIPITGVLNRPLEPFAYSAIFKAYLRFIFQNGTVKQL